MDASSRPGTCETAGGCPPELSVTATGATRHRHQSENPALRGVERVKATGHIGSPTGYGADRSSDRNGESEGRRSIRRKGGRSLTSYILQDLSRLARCSQPASHRALSWLVEVRFASPNGQIWACHFNSYVMANLATEALRSKSEDITMAQIGFDAGNNRPVFASGRTEPGSSRICHELVKLGCKIPPECASILNRIHRGISSVGCVRRLMPAMGASAVKSISENQQGFVPGERV